ncbi:hypothetical protein [Ulvibacterium sp.]|uniref:hypothetical protein n=1 Tax=Ulvibacterium sp. TaxID=2665914 RepID=UPI003BABE9F1
MIIATYNIQNLFHRHIDLIHKNQNTKSKLWKEEFEALIHSKKRLERDYDRMRELANLLGFHKSPHEPYLYMKNMEGNLHVRSAFKTLDTRASHLTDWNGWTKIKTVPVVEKAISNKAKVILEIGPDILILQEVENRESLIEFNKIFFNASQDSRYNEIMHLQGNDAMGLGMGVLLKKGYHIKSIKSFSNEMDEQEKRLFNNDFQWYEIGAPNNTTLDLLCCQLANENHSNSFRKKQAAKVRTVYEDILSNGQEDIIIAGTFNVPSYSDSILPIMEIGVTDVVKHSSFDVEVDSGEDAGYFRMGAYCRGVNIKRKDYLLVSPALFERIQRCGMNRKGIWPLSKPVWETYDSIKNEKDSASDHPLLWADILLENPIRLLRRSA